MRKLRVIIILSLVGIGVLAAVIGTIVGSINGDRMYRTLLSRSELKSVELYIAINPDNDSLPRRIVFQNDSTCNEINSTFKYLIEITPDRPRVQTGFVRMTVFKEIKMEMFISKTTYSGWVIYIMEKSYKDDSLISVLNKYAKIEH